MSDKAKETKNIRYQVPDEERCSFTTDHGNRCRSPPLGSATGQCVMHAKGREDEAQAQAVAAQLLANDVELRTKDDVNRLASQLFTMVAEKRISRQDGSLLAYIASVLLQTITPVRKKANVEKVEEFFESVAPPIRERQRVDYPAHNAGPMAGEAGTLGKNHNPYLHTGRLR
jgi:hypothetical protein